MKTNPPDGREALRILGSLVNRAPTHRMQLADTMVAAGTAEEVSRADAIYAQLLTDGGAPDALWPKRLAAVRRLVALDAGEQAQQPPVHALLVCVVEHLGLVRVVDLHGAGAGRAASGRRRGAPERWRHGIS
jgi:hypothetical protein